MLPNAVNCVAVCLLSSTVATDPTRSMIAGLKPGLDKCRCVVVLAASILPGDLPEQNGEASTSSLHSDVQRFLDDLVAQMEVLLADTKPLLFDQVSCC